MIPQAERANRVIQDSVVDLLVMGSTPAGLSVAVEAARSGVESVLVLSLDDTIPDPHLDSPRSP